MALTLEEMEREAYQRGDGNRAELLRLAIDGESTAILDAEWRADAAEEEIDEHKQSLEDCRENMYRRLTEIEDALGDPAECKEIIKQLRAESEGY